MMDGSITRRAPPRHAAAGRRKAARAYAREGAELEAGRDQRRPASSVPPRRPPHTEPVGDVLEDAHVREQGVALEDHADMAFARRQAVTSRTAEQHLAAAWARNSRQPGLSKVDFARAARPQKGDELALADCQIQRMDRGERSRICGKRRGIRGPTSRTRPLIALAEASGKLDGKEKKLSQYEHHHGGRGHDGRELRTDDLPHLNGRVTDRTPVRKNGDDQLVEGNDEGKTAARPRPARCWAAARCGMAWKGEAPSPSAARSRIGLRACSDTPIFMMA